MLLEIHFLTFFILGYEFRANEVLSKDVAHVNSIDTFTIVDEFRPIVFVIALTQSVT